MLEHDELLKRHRKKPIATLEDFEHRVEYGLDDIKKLIPHREPFLLIDKILALDYEKGIIIGSRKISADDAVFAGHFPDYKIYPGVLEIEMIGQLGLCLHYFVKNETNELAEDAKPEPVRATKVLGAYFLEPVVPDDEVIIIAKKLFYMEIFGTIIGQVIVKNKVSCVSIGEVIFLDE